MYECDIIEVEDFGFNHYIHHIDEEEDGFYIYVDEYYLTDESKEEEEW